MENYGVDFGWDDPEVLAEKVNASILKSGYRLAFSWEMLAPPKGRSVPIGVRWWQHLGYMLFVPIFRFSQWLNARVESSRHVWATGGYDWEPAELKEFSQKTKWVEE